MRTTKLPARSGYEKDEVFHDNQTLKKILSELWIKVKASRHNP